MKPFKKRLSPRLVGLLVSLLLLAFGCMTLASEAQAADFFAGGNGAEGSPYQIGTAEQLNEIRNYPSSDFLLIDNIDLSAYTNWVPIDGFKGTLDGGGHIISHLTVSTTGDAGLFTSFRVEGTRIHNLIIEDVNIHSTGSTGGLAGFVSAGTYDEISVRNGTIEAKKHVGGLFGYAQKHVEVRNSSTNVAVTGTDHVGGLIGRNYSNDTDRLLVENSEAHGPVVGNGKYVGGLLGSLNLGDVRQSTATGTVKNSGSRTGGLVGIMEKSSTIENSSAEGNITSTSSNFYTGGLVGYLTGSARIENSAAAGDVTGNTATGGLVGGMDGSTAVLDSTASGKIKSSLHAGGLVGWIDEKGQISGSSASGQVDGGSNVGGLAGFMSGPNTRIGNSFATGDVKGQSAVGGFVGNFEKGKIASSHATGDVTANAAGNVQNGRGGGIAGLANSTASMKDVYYEGKVSCTSFCGGIVGAANGSFTLDGAYALGEVSISEPYNSFLASAAGIIGYTGSSTTYKVANAYALQTRIDGSKITDNSIGRVIGNYSKQGKLSNLRANPDMDLLYIDNGGVELPAPGLTTFTGLDVDTEVAAAEAAGTFDSLQIAYPVVNAIPYAALKNQLLARLGNIEIFELKMPDPAGTKIVGKKLEITPQVRKQGLDQMDVTVTLATYSVTKTLDNPYSLLDWTEVPITWDMADEEVPDGNYPSANIQVKSPDTASVWSYTWNQPIRLDRTGPDLNVTAQDEEGKPYSGPSAKPISVSASASDALSTYKIEYQLDGGGWKDYTGPIKLESSGSYSVEFRATDEAGNVTTENRTVVVSLTGPTIGLLGDSTLRWPVGKPFVDPGYKADSVYFGDLTDDVTFNLGGLNAASPADGTYSIEYSVTDEAGLSAHATRTVEVFDDFPKPSVEFPGAGDQLIGTAGSIRLPISVWTEGWEELTVSAELFGVTRQAKLTPPEHEPDDSNVELVWNAADLPSEMGTPDLTITISGALAGTHTYSYNHRLAVDKMAPVITVVPKLGDGSSYHFGDASQEAITVSASVYGGPAAPNAFDYRIDGEAWVSYDEAVLFEATGSYALEFRSVDTLGNVSVWGPETIKVNNDNPVITLIGPDILEFPIHSVYHEPGFKAQSALYGNLFSDVTVTGSVYDGQVLSHTGQFELHYDVKDPSGRSALTKTRIVRVYDPDDITGINLDPVQVRIEEGQTAHFELVAHTADGSTKDVTGEAIWTIAHPDIATLSGPGMLEGLKQGETVVSATYGGLTEQAKVTVVRIPDPTPPGPGPSPGGIPSGGTPSGNDQPSESDIRFYTDGALMQSQWELRNEWDTNGALTIATTAVGDEYKLEIDASILADWTKPREGNRVVLETPLAIYEFDLRDVMASWNGQDRLNLTLAVADADVRSDWQNWLTGQGTTAVGELLDFELQWINDSGNAEAISRFQTPIVRRIPIQDRNRNAVMMAYDPTTGEARAVPSMVDTVKGERYLTFIRFGNSFYAPVQAAAPKFVDVNGHWANADIRQLAERAIIRGVSEERFEPDRAITRAEFAALLVRGFGLMPGNAAAVERFSDAEAESWYAADVAGAWEAGLISGYEDGTFHPGRTISREETTVMLDRLLSMLPLSESLPDEAAASFADAQRISSFAKEAVRHLASIGLISGKDGNRFAPQDELTRAEAAAMIRRIWKALGWTDNQ